MPFSVVSYIVGSDMTESALFSGGPASLSLLLTATLSWDILYIMTRRASLRRSSGLRHLRCCIMSPTLDVFRSSPLNHFYFVNVRNKMGDPIQTMYTQVMV